MFRSISIVVATAALASGVVLAAPATGSQSKLSANQIAEKSIAAQGGASAWKRVNALTWVGKMEAGGTNRPQLAARGMPKPAKTITEQPQLPFVLQMQRPRKSRLELQFEGQTAVQVYDGVHGWKLRPYLNRNDVDPYTQDELKMAATQADLDGLLVDYANKGTKIELAGRESVEGHDAYKLKLVFKDKRTQYVWIDSQSFLQTKLEGMPRKLDGRFHPVVIYLRDYRSVNGLMMPHLIETHVDDVKQVEKIFIEKVAVNPTLDKDAFNQPRMLSAKLTQ
jgi:hypothetical protein